MKPILLAALVLVCVAGISQSVVLTTSPDTLFPVTNHTFEIENANTDDKLQDIGTSVRNIVKGSGKYFIAGQFTNLAKPTGSNAVVDTAGNIHISPGKYRINGKVHTAIADGQGGFYIGGSFTRVGDSVRNYIAQLDANGKPTAWKPVLDSVVKKLFIRGDTLFVAGGFTYFNGKPKSRFAMYSITGDTLCTNGGSFGFTALNVINSFALYGDTMIFGGIGKPPSFKNIYKYNVRTNAVYSWSVQYPEYGEIKDIAISPDQSIVLFSSYSNGEFIKGHRTGNGTQVYWIHASMNWIQNPKSGTIYGLQVHGGKAYVAGHFNWLLPATGGNISRKGFASFNPNTGAIHADNLNLDWHTRFLHLENGRVYLSGQFSQVNGVSREHFAAVDTGSLAVNAWEPAPTDALTALAFAGSRAFMAGDFTGIHSVRRVNIAAIDSATGDVLPFAPAYARTDLDGKMELRGDSLFLYDHGSRCGTSQSSLRVINTVTGAFYPQPSPLSFTKLHDWEISDDWLYAAADQKLQRYHLPDLNLDVSWGHNWSSTPGWHHYIFDIIKADTLIYAVGDNVLIDGCSNAGPRRGYFGVYSAATGGNKAIWRYEHPNSVYETTAFRKALVAGNSIYVNGSFSNLNGTTRHNWVKLEMQTGAQQNWVPDTTQPMDGYVRAAIARRMTLINGKLVFASVVLNGSYPETFHGLAAIDTASGAIQPILTQMNVNDWVLGNDEVVLVGGFDTANGYTRRNLARYRVASIVLPVQLVSFNGSCANGQVELRWEVAAETRMAQYEVQSAAGSEWRSAGIVMAGSGAVGRYAYTTPGGARFYRLKMTGQDGSVEYSKVFAINCEESQLRLKAYPVPATGQLNLEIGAPRNGRAALRLMNVAGAVLRSQLVQVGAGTNTIPFDLTGLAGGTYLLRLEAAGEVKSVAVVVGR